MSDLNSQHNVVVWADIPVLELERAVAFYIEVLKNDVTIETIEDVRFAVLDHEQGNGGCLVPAAPEKINKSSLYIYLNVNDRIQDAVSKVEPNGGKIIQPVISIGPHGYCAKIEDSEGNNIALHSNSDS